MGMVRPLLPKAEQGQAPTSPDGSSDGKHSKRRCVSSACIPCRKRKSKCDGATPQCSTCVAVYHTECAYEVDESQRRKAGGANKDQADGPRERNGASGVVLASMRNSTESEAAEILQQLRSGESVEALAESLKTDAPWPGPADPRSLEHDMADVPGTPTVGRSGETRYFGHSSILGLVPSDDDVLPGRLHVPTESWTRVTQDAGLVGRLLALYFCWQHPLYLLFSQECFLHDMAQGRAKYCSPLLVNAILACSCSFADPDDAQMEPHPFRLVSDGFFAEARRLLFEHERSSLTTVQALAVMSLREVSCGRDSSGFHYAGRCMRMALELGLHLGLSGAGAHRLTATEIEVRKITFWGCFTLDNIWSVSVGRISCLPRTAIRVEKPTLTKAVEMRPWRPYAGPQARFPREVEQPSHMYAVLHQMSVLSEIVNDAVFMFYAPRERFTSKKLLELHGRYRRWHQAVPPYLRITEHPTPQVVYLHMYYHTVVLHLFRPLLRVDILDADISPREICSKCAEQVASLADLYDRIFGLQRVCLLMSHCILSASAIHLLNLPSDRAARYLTVAVKTLRAMAVNHPFAGRCMRIIVSLSQKWKIGLPDEVERIMASEQAPSSSPSSTSFFPVFPIRDVQSDVTRETVTDLLPTVDGTSAPTTTAGGLFWSPFPYQGYPLQADFEVGPMDLSAVLDTSGSAPTHFSRDGFRISTSGDSILNASDVAASSGADWGCFDWDRQ